MKIWIATLAACAAIVPAAADAHHSFAMFDSTKRTTLTGVIKEFQWTNPHVVILLEARAEGQAADVWAVELASPGNLTRQGWTRQELKPGDKVSVIVSPLRDGGHGGSFRQLTLTSTGQVLSNGTLAQPPP